MAKKVKGPAKMAKGESCCPLTSQPRLRLASDAQTDSIRANFPLGIAKPALRALYAAGLTNLDQLTKMGEAELTSLHGMGPKAIGILREALRVKGLNFRGA